MELGLYFRYHGSRHHISEIMGPGLHFQDHGNSTLKVIKL